MRILTSRGIIFTRISPLRLRYKDLRVSIIVAVARNDVIGREGKLPWRLPHDLNYFKSVTLGKPIIMGRKTFESIGGPLPARNNLVISRNTDFRAEGVKTFLSLMPGIEHSREIGATEVIIIGGAALYREALSFAHRLYITEVHATIEGDVYFPTINLNNWVERSREYHSADKGNEYDHSFVVYESVALTKTL